MKDLSHAIVAVDSLVDYKLNLSSSNVDKKKGNEGNKGNLGKMKRRINIKNESCLSRRVQIHSKAKVNPIVFYVLVSIDFEIAPKRIGCQPLLLKMQVMMVVLVNAHQE